MASMAFDQAPPEDTFLLLIQELTYFVSYCLPDLHGRYLRTFRALTLLDGPRVGPMASRAKGDGAHACRRATPSGTNLGEIGPCPRLVANHRTQNIRCNGDI